MNDKKSPTPSQPAKPGTAHVRKPLAKNAADAKGDFFFDELMTAQPDATQEYFRQQLMKHVAKKPEGDAK